MKKILFVINSLANGGAERALVNLVNNLSKSDYEITLFTLYSSNIFDKQIDEKVHYKYMFKEKGRFKRRLLLALFCRIIPKKILHKILFGKRYDYEIAFLQGFPTDLIARSSNKQSQKITFVHSDFSTNFDVCKWYKDVKECKSIYSKFDKVCFVSQTVKEGFNKTVGDSVAKQYVIHNVNDSQRILELAKEEIDNLSLSTTEKRIVSVGRLIPIKAFDRIIYAIKRLRDEGVFAQCWIIGDGPERDRLKNLINDNGLQGVINLLGYQQNPYKFLRHGDLYVCSSTTEGYNTATVEALILGVPVLTTQVSGAEEIISSTNCGLIVENSNEGVYVGLKKLLTNNERLNQMKLSAKSRAKQFTTKEQMKEFIAMLKEGK